MRPGADQRAFHSTCFQAILSDMNRWLPIVSCIWIAACGRPDPRPDPAQCEPPVYDEEAVRNARPAPGGEGWCCPASVGFAYVGTLTGGYADDPCECATHHSIDAPPCVYLPSTDSRGCETYRVDWSCVLDAGALDAGSLDAGTAPDASP